MTTTITKPGVYEMTDIEYHADPVPGGSLSSAGARKLLPPGCPALFQYEREHGRPDTKAFDMGHAAHEMVLGGGPEIVRVDADSWRTTAAKDIAAAARARGAVPLLAADYEKTVAMAAAIRAHPFAGRLFGEGTGTPEASIFWQDDPTAIWRRARLDWLPNGAGGGRLVIPDYKTCVSAQRDEFAKSAVNYGYHQQMAFYIDAVKAIGLADDAVFVFVAQEKAPPYLVNVVQLDVLALRIGQHLNRLAIDVYAECERTNRWPSYSDDVELTSLPGWYENRFADAL